ncbi:MAG: hypothetical protein Q8K30_05540 [Candidatus Gracilibacteria bacterium]|nr:hypothetical protein [Candidatus Gracilibacteria bacterium]
MYNSIEESKGVDLIEYFGFIRPSIKFLTQSKNVIELNNLLEGFFIKIEENYDDKQIVKLSLKISKSNIDDKIKIRILTQLNIIMYNIYHNNVLKQELEEVRNAVQGLL